MERSIENIWKSDAPLAPKIQDLYTRKSQLTTAKIERTMKRDIWSIWLLIALVLGGLGYAGHWLFGGAVALFLAGLFFYNRRLLHYLQSIRLETEVEAYVEQYLAALRKIIRHTSRLMVWGMAPAATACIFYWWYATGTGSIQTFGQEEPGWKMALLALGFWGFMALYSWGVYRLVTFFLYGRKIRKLKEVLADLRALQ